MIDAKTNKPCFCGEGGVCDNCYEFEYERADKAEARVAELEKELDQTEALGRSILSDIVCEDYATAKKRAKLFYKDARA